MSLIGRKVGNYVLESLVGEGAMGHVYLARHPLIGRELVVKVLRAELSGDGEVVGRFFQEARAVNAVYHPNIVGVIDYGFVDDLYYFTMERLEGQDLATLLSKRGLTLDESRHVLAQCASALAACHERGIIHRDLKPENIFLTRRGSDPLFVKLLDFGAAKLTRPGARVVRTAAGGVFGTPFYMSPEQASGATQIDGRADIYSLGVIMYELFTGELPFDEPTAMETLLAHVNKPVPRPCQLNPKLPPQLEAICLVALEKDPARRFASAKEVEQALDDPDRYFSGWSSDAKGVVVAQPYRRRSTTLVVQRTVNGPRVTMQRLPRRWIRQSVAGAVLAAAVVIGIAWATTGRAPEPIATPAASQSQPAIAPPGANAAAASRPPDTTMIGSASLVGAAPTVRSKRQLRRRSPDSDPVVASAPPRSDPDTTLVDPDWATPHGN